MALRYVKFVVMLIAFISYSYGASTKEVFISALVKDCGFTPGNAEKKVLLLRNDNIVLFKKLIVEYKLCKTGEVRFLESCVVSCSKSKGMGR